MAPLFLSDSINIYIFAVLFFTGLRFNSPVVRIAASVVVIFLPIDAPFFLVFGYVGHLHWWSSPGKRMF